MNNFEHKLKKELGDDLNFKFDPKKIEFERATNANPYNIYNEYKGRFVKNFQIRAKEETKKEIKKLINDYLNYFETSDINKNINNCKEMASKILEKIENMNKKINRSEKEEKLDEINDFFKNVYNYQEMINEVMKNFKNEMNNPYGNFSSGYEEMKKTKKWLYFNIGESEGKMHIKYAFDPAKIIKEIY